MIIGSNNILIENLSSTNSYASDLLRKSRPTEGTIIYTNYQSAGRGYQGNSWESEAGKNLLFSIIVYPEMIDASDQFIISMALSLGICDFLGRYTSQYSIKWPNDIYSGNDKIAGILIENSLMGNRIENTVAGIGLNINQNEFSDNIPNPVSLSLLTGKSHKLEKCLNQLTTDIDRRYKQLISEKFEAIRKEYNNRLYRLNEWHNFKDKKGVYSGRIKNVTNIGRLQVETEDENINEYSFKELEFIL